MNYLPFKVGAPFPEVGMPKRGKGRVSLETLGEVGTPTNNYQDLGGSGQPSVRVEPEI
jgi:hypothetical protein